MPSRRMSGSGKVFAEVLPGDKVSKIQELNRYLDQIGSLASCTLAYTWKNPPR
jgi:hypothetical protein